MAAAGQTPRFVAVAEKPKSRTHTHKRHCSTPTAAASAVAVAALNAIPATATVTATATASDSASTTAVAAMGSPTLASLPVPPLRIETADDDDPDYLPDLPESPALTTEHYGHDRAHNTHFEPTSGSSGSNRGDGKAQSDRRPRRPTRPRIRRGAFPCAICTFVGSSARSYEQHMRRDHHGVQYRLPTPNGSGSSAASDSPRSAFSFAASAGSEDDGGTSDSEGRNSTGSSVGDGGRLFPCSECGKHFSRRSNLLRHERIHRGIKRFQCDVCGRRMAEKHHLMAHLRTHEGAKESTPRATATAKRKGSATSASPADGESGDGEESVTASVGITTRKPNGTAALEASASALTLDASPPASGATSAATNSANSSATATARGDKSESDQDEDDDAGDSGGHHNDEGEERTAGAGAGLELPWPSCVAVGTGSPLSVPMRIIPTGGKTRPDRTAGIDIETNAGSDSNFDGANPNDPARGDDNAAAVADTATVAGVSAVDPFNSPVFGSALVAPLSVPSPLLAGVPMGLALELSQSAGGRTAAVALVSGAPPRHMRSRSEGDAKQHAMAFVDGTGTSALPAWAGGEAHTTSDAAAHKPFDLIAVDKRWRRSSTSTGSGSGSSSTGTANGSENALVGGRDSGDNCEDDDGDAAACGGDKSGVPRIGFLGFGGLAPDSPRATDMAFSGNQSDRFEQYQLAPPLCVSATAMVADPPTATSAPPSSSSSALLQMLADRESDAAPTPTLAMRTYIAGANTCAATSSTAVAALSCAMSDTAADPQSAALGDSFASTTAAAEGAPSALLRSDDNPIAMLW